MHGAPVRPRDRGGKCTSHWTSSSIAVWSAILNRQIAVTPSLPPYRVQSGSSCSLVGLVRRYISGILSAAGIYDGRPMAEPFIERVADCLMEVPGVVAVHFGGSRAAGTARADSDWDCSIYYRGRFDVDGIRALGPGPISELGGWGPVMNGGAWLTVDLQTVDVHYRDLDDIDRLRAEVDAGRFTVYRSPFFLAGIPSYVPLAELGSGLILRGHVARAEFPQVLRSSAGGWWVREAEMDLQYAAHVSARSPGLATGLIAKALIEAANGRLCREGKWVTNEKHAISAAGLGDVEAELASRVQGPDTLMDVAAWLRSALHLQPWTWKSG